MTLTVAHGPLESWSYTYDRLLDGLRALTKGKAGRVVSELIEATIRATESTWSARNGWHVHFHVLWKTRRPLLEAEKAIVRERWAEVTGASASHGLRFGAAFDCSHPAERTAAARYVSKLGHEMSGAQKSAHAEHFTLGEVFARAATQNDDRVAWVARVRHYQEATHGRRLYQLDRRAKAIHDGAPELPELVVLREWRTTVDRLEFSGLSRAERYGHERLAVYLPLEVAARSRGDPAGPVGDSIDALLRAFDA